MVEYKTPRRVPGYAVAADAEITDLASKIQIKAQTNMLSPFGCSVESSKLFPQGSDVRLKLSHLGSDVRVSAIVVYSTPELGMGFAFTSVELEYEPVLERWIAEYLRN